MSDKQAELLKTSLDAFKKLYNIVHAMNNYLLEIVDELDNELNPQEAKTEKEKVEITESLIEEDDYEAEEEESTSAEPVKVEEVLPPTRPTVNPLEEVEKVKVEDTSPQDEKARFKNLVDKTQTELNIQDTSPEDIAKIMPDKKTGDNQPSTKTIEQQINKQLKDEAQQDIEEAPAPTPVVAPATSVVEQRASRINRRLNWGANQLNH